MNSRSMLLALPIAVAVALPAMLGARAHAPAAATSAKGDSTIQAQSHVLPNGLPLIVVEKHGTATFEALVGCLGGSAFDPPGGSGTAHLVEHVLSGAMIGAVGPPPELWKQLSEEYGRTRGAASDRIKTLEAEIAKAKGRGDWNIGTTADLVYYGVQAYPAEWLDRFLVAASKTLKEPPSETVFEVQKQSLVDEVKKTIPGDARGQVTSPHLTTVFPPTHPYGAPVGARLEAVERMTIDSVRAFKSAYYQPSRCAVALVGDVPPDAFFKLAASHFADVPTGTPPSVSRPERPHGERRATIVSPAGPMVLVTFVKPSMPARDDAIAQVVASLVGGGPGSRFSRDLVDGGVATKAFAGNGGPGQYFDSMLSFQATPASGHDADEVEAAILQELGRLQTEPIGDGELRAAIERFDANTEAFYKDTWAVVLGLLRYQLIAGDWKAMARDREACHSVTPQEIVTFARTYLTADNRAILRLLAPLPGPGVRASGRPGVSR